MRHSRTTTTKPQDADAKPVRRLPQRGSTKQMHERLLRVLGDRRFKRART